jgi:(S)-ureidoglycine-glyoxylate aminotransferase
MEAVTRRRKIFDAVRALTLRGARLRPLVLVVEDLHWIDTSSEEFLSSLMDAVAAVPLLLILTYRVEYTPPFGSRSFYTTLTLHSLSEAETAAMASRVLGTAQFPQELHTALMQKAEGVPLFIEEVTKTLLDLGVLQQENGDYRLVKSLDEVRVPDTIQGIIMARLDRLGEDGKRTVQLAAVIGRQFLVRLLERIAGLTGQLGGLLQELKTLEIIYELGLLPEPAYIFKHALIQDVAYHTLLIQRRKELHRAVGYAIEELYPDRLANHYEELAHHFAQGEAWEKAFDYLVLAGDKAKNAYATQIAFDFYARALVVAPRVVPSIPARRITEIYQRRGQVYLLLARYPEAIAEAEHMRESARAAGDRQSEGEALTDLALYHFSMASWDHISQAQRLGEEALSVAQESSNERVVVAECGRFGLLLIELAERCGADVVAVRGEWGRAIEPAALESALEAGRTKLVATIHGETSTGVLQPLEELARLAHAHGALFMTDAVVTLGGCEVAVDRWGVDIAVAGTQKCLSCPSGLAPVTFNARAEAAIRARRTKVRSNYLDLGQLIDYWGPARFNHHTAPTSMVYGLREALRAVQGEGLAARFARHRLHGDALRAGLDALGLVLFGSEPPARRLPFITPVMVPKGVDELRVRRRLIEDFGIEIGAAFGPLQGRIWRIGTMGYAARRENVLLGLAALEHVLRREGWDSEAGAGVDAALAHYDGAGTAPGLDVDESLGARGIGRV